MSQVNNTKARFSVTIDEKLVESVSKFPCLYNFANTLYKNHTVKDNAWMQVAESVERSVDDCKKRWRNIKDTYQKRSKKGIRTGSKRKQWALADMLSFLDQADHKRKSTSNIITGDASTQEDADYACSENEIDSTPKQNADQTQPIHKRQKKKDKLMQLMKEKRKERNEILKNLSPNRDDDIDVFFKSIAMSVKKLRPELVNEAKMKALQMVFDLEKRNASLTAPPQFSPSESSGSSVYSEPLTLI